MINIILKKINKCLLIRVLLKKEKVVLGKDSSEFLYVKIVDKPILYLPVSSGTPRLN